MDKEDIEKDLEEKTTGISFLIIIILIWFFFLRGQDTWTGFYYPDESNLIKYIKSPEYKNVDECREWVNFMIGKYNPNGYGYDYECGKNCKLSDSGIDIYHCKESVE